MVPIWCCPMRFIAVFLRILPKPFSPSRSFSRLAPIRSQYPIVMHTNRSRRVEAIHGCSSMLAISAHQCSPSVLINARHQCSPSLTNQGVRPPSDMQVVHLESLSISNQSPNREPVSSPTPTLTLTPTPTPSSPTTQRSRHAHSAAHPRTHLLRHTRANTRTRGIRVAQRAAAAVRGKVLAHGASVLEHGAQGPAVVVVVVVVVVCEAQSSVSSAGEARGWRVAHGAAECAASLALGPWPPRLLQRRALRSSSAASVGGGGGGLFAVGAAEVRASRPARKRRVCIVSCGWTSECVRACVWFVPFLW